MSARSSPPHGPRPSVVAIVLCLMIVAGSVLFGVLGPGIAQRSMLSGATSVGDLATSAVALRDHLFWQALEVTRLGEPARERESATPGAEVPGEAELRADAAAAMAKLLGREVTIPDLSSAGYALAAWRPVSLRGGRDDAIALGYLDASRESFLALYLLADEGQFVVFDGFGRAVPLLPDRLLVEATPAEGGGEALAMVWSTGPVLAIAVPDSEEEAELLRAPLGAP